MAQTPEGARRIAAARIGIPFETYEAMLAAGMKWCTTCKKWHKRREFGADSSRTDGLSTRCLASQIVAADRPGTRERRIALTKGLSWCGTCLAWLPHDEVRQGKCREHRNEAAREWYAANAAEVCARKSARRRGLEPIPTWWRDDAFARFDGLCAYGCGRLAEALDHVTPVALGGISEPANLVPVCVICNSQKRHHDPAPWVARGFKTFPDQWFDLYALAAEVGRSTDWAEAA